MPSIGDSLHNGLSQARAPCAYSMLPKIGDLRHGFCGDPVIRVIRFAFIRDVRLSMTFGCRSTSFPECSPGLPCSAGGMVTDDTCYDHQSTRRQAMLTFSLRYSASYSLPPSGGKLTPRLGHGILKNTGNLRETEAN